MSITNRRLRSKLARRRLGQQRRKARGVVLLLIISLLSMFSLITITYVVSASSHKQAAYALEKSPLLGYYGTDPKDIADNALYLVVAGTRNPRSPFVFHDLLGDMYGHFGMGGTVEAVEEKANGEFLEITIRPTPGTPFGRDKIEDMGYLAGSVITMLNGECIGLSSHIFWKGLGSSQEGDGPVNKIRVRPFLADEPRKAMPAGQDRFWINGQPFAGLGFGYNRETHKLDKQGDGGLVRESPNFAEAFGKNTSSFRDWQRNVDETLLFGGANEEYDAADMDNFALAYIPSEGRTNIIPSFHRPKLLEGGESRRVMLRPSKRDHINFTGSNPRFDPVAGPWDVDNDRDGTNDSVWIDPGWPAQVGADGRTYKHLVAIQVRPLDGAVNLNATGNAAHAMGAQGDAAPKGGYGLAAGPGELDPSTLSKNPGWYKKMVGGGGGGGGRVDPKNISKYGPDGKPGGPQDQDRLRKSRQLNYPENYQWEGKHPMARDFATPPPLLRSNHPLDLDTKTGQPAWDKPSPVADGGFVSPYELDLSRNASVGPLPKARDAPYTIAEYERVLRRNDGDATALPARLWHQLPEDLRNRPELFTTISYDVPQPNVQTPMAIRAMTLDNPRDGVSPENARVAKSYIDILRARIKKEGGGDVEKLLMMYVPPEMRAGLRMDLNRPFGNGVDDNRNGIIDEGGVVAQSKGEGDSGNPIQGLPDSNILNDDPHTTDKNLVREIYIRNLYVLILTLCTSPEQQPQTPFCREVAQYCTNICDFRDRDFIMTRFSFDTNPWDGWSPGNSRDTTVFGCERPELIITEALAGHDTRIEEDGGQRVQRDKPQGWVYVELYNPWTDKEAFSGELYQHSRSTQLSTGVVLDQLSPPLTPGSAISAKPVWRLMFHRSEYPNLEDPFESSSEGENARTFYFDDKPVTRPGDGTRNQWDFFRRDAQPIAPIRPGQFAVVGSRRIQQFGSKGKVELTPSNNSTGCVVNFFENRVGPDPWSNLPPVAIIIDGQRRPGGGDTGSVERPGSITEPGSLYNDYNSQPAVGGYPDLIREPGNNTQHTYREVGGQGTYIPEFKRPLDSWRSDESVGTLTTAGRLTRGYRIMHLQRLADPSKPFHEQQNPFRTIDSMRIDMVTHNTKQEADNLRFVSRERGVTAEQQHQLKSMLWMQETKLNATLPEGQMVHSFGKRNKSLGGEGGDASKPYPWLTFFNRPYANHMELLLVPRGNSNQLLQESAPDGRKPGYSILEGRNANANFYDQAKGGFGHLRNFMYARGGNAGGALSVQDWAMLFEFVGVPSPFVGTEVAGNPQNWAEIKFNRPPFFNKVSSYRDPGKVNVNAIPGKEVVGVVASQPESARSEQTFRNMSSSRSGGTANNSFDRPFRSFGGADLLPPTAGREVRAIDATIFRPQTQGSTKPLFGFSDNAGAETNPWPKRNPYFFYQSMLRMANTTTTRSNQYAIWITVGKFEAEPVAPSNVFPDGFRLGAELGFDTGNIERHRAFYVFDRTIPVAAQLGEINNVHRAILISRLIE